jgi:hypothetical protein
MRAGLMLDLKAAFTLVAHRFRVDEPCLHYSLLGEVRRGELGELDISLILAGLL